MLSVRVPPAETMIAQFCLACLAGLLVMGALTDIEDRRLPNWLTAAVILLYGIFVIVSPAPVDWMGASLVAALVFAFGFASFAFHLMGGGDVKLMTGLALWAGVEHIALFLIVTSLAGGLLAIAMIMLRKGLALPFAHLLANPIAKKRAASLVHAGPAPAQGAQAPELSASLPYGVAIGAGGIAVIYALLQL